MDATTLTRICTDATRAPSGHNAQPWHLAWDGNTLTVSADDERDQTPINDRQWGTFMACGAFLATLKAVAPAYGYAATISIDARDDDSSYRIGTVTFTPTDDSGVLYYTATQTRTTNRHLYQTTPLSDALIQSFHELTEPLTLSLFTDEDTRLALTSHLSTIDGLALSERVVHQSLFPHIRWNAREERQYRDGLYLATMELPKPVQLLFRAFRYWPIARRIGRTGMPDVIARQNAQQYATAAAIGIISAPQTDRETIVRAGYALQQLWIRAEQQGVALHPIAGTLYLGRRTYRGEALGLSSQAAQRLASDYAYVRDCVEGEPLMAFRIGVPQRPATTGSSRQSPRIHGIHTNT